MTLIILFTISRDYTKSSLAILNAFLRNKQDHWLPNERAIRDKVRLIFRIPIFRRFQTILKLFQKSLQNPMIQIWLTVPNPQNITRSAS